MAVEAARLPGDDRRWWAAGFVGGALLFAAMALLAHKHTVSGVNLTIFRQVNNWPDSLRLFFLAVTGSSNSLWVGIVAVLVTFLLKLQQLTWQLAAAIIGAFAVGFLGKHIVAQPRPFHLLADVHQRVAETDASFPSGHTLVVTVVVLVLWPYLPRGWRWLVALLIPLMGLSRIYLGVHTPIDIIGGFALGLVVVSAMRILPARMRKFFCLD